MAASNAQHTDNKTGNVLKSIPVVKSNQPSNPVYSNLKFLIAGILFGIFLIKGEVVSWFRIQEMFRFQSFHMYGILCSAIYSRGDLCVSYKKLPDKNTTKRTNYNKTKKVS